MKRILFCAAAFLLAACDRGGNFDATGTFEATEVTVSAEAAGRILRFDAEEGDLLTAESRSARSTPYSFTCGGSSWSGSVPRYVRNGRI